MITISGKSKGIFWPIATIDDESLREKGFDGQFILKYAGQRSQLIIEPSACVSAMPHDDKPEHDLKSFTGGNPERGNRCSVEKMTIFFATGHSNFESAISAPHGLDEGSNV